MASRALVIGLDRAPPQLLLGRRCDEPQELHVLAEDDVASGPSEERDLRDIGPALVTALEEPMPAEMEGRSVS